MSKKIVEAHKGSLSVHSDDNGTMFVVWLPLKQQKRLWKDRHDEKLGLLPRSYSASSISSESDLHASQLSSIQRDRVALNAAMLFFGFPSMHICHSPSAWQ